MTATSVMTSAVIVAGIDVVGAVKSCVSASKPTNARTNNPMEASTILFDMSAKLPDHLNLLNRFHVMRDNKVNASA
jgi:hypothetical protein